MPEKSDELIAEAVQRGDANAFGVLIETYEAKIKRYGKKFIANTEDINDLVQDIFIKAYRNIQSFDTSRRFSPWIYRIAHNEFVNALKKKSSVIIFPIDFDTLFPHPVAKETADGNAINKEIAGLLMPGLQKLNPKYREPLILYYIEDLDYKTIAEILEIPIATVGVRLQRGKALLKKMVDEKGEQQ